MCPGHYVRAFGINLDDYGYKWNAYQGDNDVFYKEIVATEETDVLTNELENFEQLFPKNPFTKVVRG